MGIVCEFYRVSDKLIDTFLTDPISANSYIEKNYTCTDGLFHIEGDTHFYTDKGWAIALYLLKAADATGELQLLDGTSIDKDSYDTGQYIKSGDVHKINEILVGISADTALSFYDEEKMVEEYVYRAGQLTNKDFISEHIITIKKAFSRAAEKNDGIIVQHL